MQRRKIVGLACVAMFALFAIASATASAALPSVSLLAGEKFSVLFEGTSSKGVLETVKGTTVNCSSGKNSGSIEGEKTGKTTITFEGCESSGFKCNTTGKGAGIIETSGNTTLVFDSLTPLAVALLLAVNETTFECTALVKVKVKGNILLLISPINQEVTSLTLTVTQSKGQPGDSKYWEGGTEKHPTLLSSIDGGAFEISADESTENKITTKKMIKVEG